MCQNKEGNNALTMQIDNIFKNIYSVCSLLFITYFVLFVQCTYYCRAIAVCVPFLNSVRASLLLHQIVLRACESIWNWLFVIATAAIIYIYIPLLIDLYDYATVAFCFSNHMRSIPTVKNHFLFVDLKNHHITTYPFDWIEIDFDEFSF